MDTLAGTSNNISISSTSWKPMYVGNNKRKMLCFQVFCVGVGLGSVRATKVLGKYFNEFNFRMITEFRNRTVITL